jgi:uncharacterized protein involved in exopolysaccharide biosynthesis
MIDGREQIIKHVAPVEIVPYLPRVDSFRRVVEIAERQRRVMAIAFVAVLIGAVLAGVTAAPQYDAELKLLVLHNREEPSVSAGSNSVVQAQMVTEEELNSEAEILKSRDLLENTVVACGLENMNEKGIRDRIKSVFGIKSAPRNRAQSIEQAVDKLDRNLKVKSMKKTNLLDAIYTSKNPDLSVEVLNTLTTLYLQKHVQIHRIPGAVPFFEQETKRFQDELAARTKELADFTQQGEIGSAQEERDRTAEKLVTFEADMRQALADAHDREQRIAVLKSELSQTPERMTTQVRESDNGALLQQMKSSLHDKELKRSELGATFSSNYPPVRTLDAQITQLQKAIGTEEKSPVRDEVSDAAPTHTFLVQEIAKANADMASRRAQATALASVVQDYRKKLSGLEQTTIREAELDRNVKTAEANYLLYRGKLEESRITDALDRTSIVNVSVAQPPIRPEHSAGLGLGMIAAIGAILGCCAAAASAYVIDGMASTYRTRDEVEQLLGIPVLAEPPQMQLLS